MKVSNSELQVMSILWEESPLTVGQVIERAQEETDWHPNTVKTILTRLVEKEAVSKTRDGKRYFYAPLLARTGVMTSQSEQLLDKFFNGRMAPLVAHFADQKKLSRKDIKEIEAILESLKKSK